MPRSEEAVPGPRSEEAVPRAVLDPLGREARPGGREGAALVIARRFVRVLVSSVHRCGGGEYGFKQLLQAEV